MTNPTNIHQDVDLSKGLHVGIVQTASEHEACQRLMAIPGIGPVTATAIVSAIGNGAEFKRGRGFSAWLGLVPTTDAIFAPAR